MDQASHNIVFKFPYLTDEGVTTTSGEFLETRGKYTREVPVTEVTRTQLLDRGYTREKAVYYKERLVSGEHVDHVSLDKSIQPRDAGILAGRMRPPVLEKIPNSRYECSLDDLNKSYYTCKTSIQDGAEVIYKTCTSGFKNGEVICKV